MLTRVNACRGIVVPRSTPVWRAFASPVGRRVSSRDIRRGFDETAAKMSARGSQAGRDDAPSRIDLRQHFGPPPRYFTFSVLACLIPESFYMGRILGPRALACLIREYFIWDRSYLS